MILARNPRGEYEKRLTDRRLTVSKYESWNGQVAVSRLLTPIVFVVLIGLSFWAEAIPRWSVIIPVLIFFGLVLIHERVSQGLRRATKAVKFYEGGIARIDDAWIGRGQSTEVFRDDSHLYAIDLDIFGKASLFELLCTARMRSGEETLADWLTAPAPADEIVARQQAIDELRNNVDLREDLASIGSDLRSSIHTDKIEKWGTAPVELTSQSTRWLLPIPVVFVIYTFIPFFRTLSMDPLWPLAFAIVAVIGLYFRSRVKPAVEALDLPERELKLLALLLERIEREQFKSPKLLQLRSSLDTDGVPPSEQIGRFNRLVNTLNWYRNEFFAPFSLLLLWRTQFAFALEKWRGRCGPAIGPWLKTVGEFEALCALAGYAYEHPDDPFPEIVHHGPVFDGGNLRHPLVPKSTCVPNAVRLGDGLVLLVVSGSNMSGKSTLLRTVGINAALALAGAPVRAERLRLSPLAIGATLRIQDSLQAGTSRFYAEIQRIHHIMELTKGPLPVLFLLDEVLHGTNSHDRAVGAEAIVRGLIGRGAIGLVTTHDLALANVADALAPRAANVHFDDEMVDGKMTFDYRMRSGVVHKSNALALMRAVGLDV